MSVQYGAISWNRQKKVYDLTLSVVAGTVPRHFCWCGRLAKPERDS